MKKFLLLTSLFAILLAGCGKDDKGCMPVTPQAEEPQIIAYAAANGITAQKHASGLYYQVIDPGTGTTPSVSSKVFINYTGKLLNGTTFDSRSNPASTGWLLGGLIEGWQLGLPLIKKGGKIKLIIPSSLAYGCVGAGADIPSNSVLYFYIELVDVQ